MADLAHLRIKVDSTQAQKSSRDLDTLSRSGSKAEKSTGELTKTTNKFGLALAGIGFAAAIAGLQALTRKAMEYEKAMAEVSTLVDTTVVSMNDLDKAAKGATRAFGGGAANQAKALYSIISAGASDAASANDILTQSNKLAIGGVTDVATAADGLTSVLNAYGLQASDAADVSDTMFVAMRAGKTNIEQLSAQLGMVAPLAAQTGTTFQELSSSIAALTKGGVKTSIAVQGVRAILAAVVKPTEEAKKMASSLGLEFSASALKAQGFAGFMDSVAEKTGGSTEKMAQLFGGVEALNPALALTGTAAGDFADTMEQMGVRAGSTEDALQKMRKSGAQQLGELFGKLEVAVLNLGTKMLDILGPAIAFLNQHFDKLVVFAEALAIQLAALGAAFVAGKVLTYLKNIIALERALGAASIKQALFSASLKGTTRAFRALTAVMMANPFVAIAVAVAGLIALFHTYRDEQFKIGEDTVTMGNIVAGVWTYIQKGVEFVQKVFSEGWATALGSISPHLEQLGKWFDEVLSGILKYAKLVVNKVVGFFSGIGSAAAALWRGDDPVAAFKKSLDVDYVGNFADGLKRLLVHLNDVGKGASKSRGVMASLREELEEVEDATGDVTEADKERLKALKNGLEGVLDYIKALKEQREEIGLNEVAMKRLEISRQRAAIDALEKLGLAKEEADKLRAAMDEAGGALIGAMQDDMVNQLKKQNDALREQVNLYWESAEAQARARALREGTEMGLEGDSLTAFIEESVENGTLERAKEQLDEIKRALEDVKELTFEIDLEAVFGDFGKAIGGAINALETFNERQELIAKAMKAQNLSEKEQAMLRDKQLRNQVSLYGNLAASAKGFFKEKSAGYKAMQAAETAFRAVEFALSVKATAQKVAEGAANMFAKLGPLGFAAVAGMMAVMAGFGFFGGGSGGKAPKYNEGKGTVLGDVEAQSESISRALELLNGNADATLRYTSQMAMSLRKIENNIGGLSRMVLTGAGLDASAAGVNTGGGFFKSLFGSKKSVVGQGVQADAQSLQSIIENGLNAEYFTDIKRKKKFFGITTGTKYYTQTAGMDAQMKDQMGLFFANVVETLGTAGEALGVPLEVIEQRLANFIVDIGKIDLKDLSGDEVTAALEAALGAEADRIARVALSGLGQFQKVGEGYFETVVRVAATFEAFTSTMMGLGNETDVTLESIMAISDLFGDLAEMTGAMNDYFATFYSDAEKLEVYMGRLGGVFADLGFTMPATMDDFKALVDSLDLNSAAGQEAFVRLMELAPVFADIIKLQEQVAQERERLEQNLVKAYRREARELEGTIEQFSRFSETLREFRDSLFRGTSTVDGYKSAMLELIKVGSLAGAGDADAMGKLQNVGQRFLSASMDRAGSLFEYQRDVAMVGGYVQGAIDAADEQVDVAQAQLDALTAQVEQLVQLNETAESVQEAIEALLAFNGVPTPSASQMYNPDAAAGEQAATSEQLARMNGTLESGLYTIAKNTGSTYKVLDTWDGDGQPETREAADAYY